MDKRLQKRHKRQVSRAKDRVKLSEPEVRTPEEIKTAREASRPPRGWGKGPPANYATPPVQGHAGSAARSPAKVDG